MTDQSSSRLNTDTATIGGFWVGSAGFACGVVGVVISIYSLFSKDPNLFWIAISGWVAALLVALAMGVVSFKLIGLVSTINRSLVDATRELSIKEAELTLKAAENLRLLEIDAYISSKALAPAKRRSTQSVPDAAPVGGQQG